MPGIAENEKWIQVHANASLRIDYEPWSAAGRMTDWLAHKA